MSTNTNLIARLTAINTERQERLAAMDNWYNAEIQAFYADFKAHYGLAAAAEIDPETIKAMYAWCQSMENREKGLAAIDALVRSFEPQQPQQQ